ncbi:MAG: M48 family metalloprotease [bacterium]|nr:M48 family metalloprotease [bacterium]
MKRLIAILLIVLTAASPVQAASMSSNELPELGDTASSIVTPEQEYVLGRAWMRQLRGSTPSVSDPLVQDYLERLAYRLAFHSPMEHPDLSLIIIKDRQINAFAVPGGVVGVNVGLLLYAETEAEAAAVLAHEFGHLSQRHFARRLAENKQNQWLYLGAMLASIALAAAGDGQAGFAGLASTQAAMVDNQLSYSRQYEQEADRIGMQTLVDSGMDPHAMPTFFQRLQRQSRQVGNIPEFILTHPLTESRITDTINRANQYPQKLTQDSLDYQLVRVRLATTYLSDSGRGVAFFQQQLIDTNANTDRARINRLGLALALTREREYAKAREALVPLLSENPQRVDYLVAATEIDFAEQKYDDAIRRLEPVLTLNPDNYPLLVYYARAQIAANHPERVIERLEAAARERSDDPQIWRLLVDAYTGSKNNLGIFRSKAEVYFLSGDNEKALEQLQLAADGAKKNYPLTAKIQKRMREMQPEKDKKS